MTQGKLHYVSGWLLLGSLLIAGCTSTPPAPQRTPDKTPAPAVAAPAAPAPAAPVPPPAPAPAPAPVPSNAERDLAEGIELYDKGEYNAAIAKLGKSEDIAAASPEIRVSALKYLAFSFCLTRRLTQCRAQFENAFKIDPSFDLAPAERGHPMWGPSFERVKKAQPK